MEKLVYSSRDDGLGHRLWSLVNAIILSDILEEHTLKFNWRDEDGSGLYQHDVGSVADIFDDDFIIKHHVNNDGLKNFQEKASKLNITNLDSTKIIDSLENLGLFNLIQAEPQLLTTHLPFLENSIDSSSHLNAFSKIKFSQNINHAIDKAKSISDGKGHISIHLRAGDIIFGQYRFTDRFVGKVLSYPEVTSIIERLKDEDQKIILFGQDESLISYFTHKYKLDSANKIAIDFKLNNIQKAFFDLVLLSQSSQIYCGSSGFSRFPCILGNIRSTSGIKNNSVVEKETLLEIANRTLNSEEFSFHRLQKAFSFWSIFVKFRNLMNDQQAIEVLGKAISLDKDNDFYKIVLAGLHIRENNYYEAEKTLESCKKKNSDGCVWKIVTKSITSELLDSSFELISSHENGFYCNLFSSAYFYRKKNFKLALTKFKICKSLNGNIADTNYVRLQRLIETM